MIHRMLNKKAEKIFCIGVNKSGTTTIEQVFKELGYKTGNQREAELLLADWGKREFNKIIKYCNKADAFQDVPFSLPFTYVILDHHYPKAKFILTVRDNVDQWYNSITKFHSNLWGDADGVPPTRKQLKEATYIYKGRPFDANRLQFDSPEDNPYQKEALCKYYNTHIHNVKSYFKGMPNKLIEINVSKKQDYRKLCEFLEKEPLRDNFPWLNKT